MKKYILILLTIILPTFLAKAQDEAIYVVSGIKPTFKGGEGSLEKYLQKNIKLPKIVKEKQVEGTVHVKFVVLKTGKITQSSILRGMKNCPECEAEALRLIAKMPNWVAGKMYEKDTETINVYKTLQLNFYASKTTILVAENDYLKNDYPQEERIYVPIEIPMEREIIKEQPKEAEPLTAEGEPIYTVVQQNPTFKGGSEALALFLKKNLKIPESVKNKTIEGKVFVKFVVSKTGKLSDCTIMRGLQKCPECDAEAMRLIKMMPDWNPAVQNGNNVNFFYALPITFKVE